uniref:Putative ovule protein n=1 Tax=Solanum chacoense TaxID=4108 RepID=A0A0V0H4I7_SOLCH
MLAFELFMYRDLKPCSIEAVQLKLSVLANTVHMVIHIWWHELTISNVVAYPVINSSYAHY